MDNGGDILRLCRLCLVKDDVNIPIFEEQGDIRQIFLKISSCLPVKVSREDKLPKKICDGCSYKLDMLYEFWNTTANAEKQLLSWLGEAGMNAKMADGTISAVAQQIKPVETFVKQEAIDPSDIHADDNDDDKSYMFQQKFAVEEAGPSATVTSNEEEPPPKRARRTAAVKAQIAMDPESDDDDDSGEPITKVEDESEESEGDDHEPPFVDVPSTSADDQPGPSGVGKDGVEAPPIDQHSAFRLKKISFTCKGCTRKFNTLGQLQRHLSRIEMEFTYLCRACKGFFDEKHPCNLLERRCLHCMLLIADSDNPRSHPCFHQPVGAKIYDPTNDQMIRELLTPKEDTKCAICEKSFDSEIDLEGHFDEIVPKTFFFCRKCVNFFKEEKNHGSDPPCNNSNLLMYCYFCKKILEEFSLKYHGCFHIQQIGDCTQEETSFMEDKDFIYICDVCGKFLPIKLKDNHDIEKHRKMETGQRKTCNVCDTHFECITELKKHKRLVHNVVLCHICGSNVPTNKIKSHIDTHNNVKKFKCTECGKEFCKRERLYVHRLVHSDETKWKCHSCGKGFKTKYNYKVHLRSHSTVKPFECVVCKKTFTTKQSRDSHLKTHTVLND